MLSSDIDTQISLLESFLLSKDKDEFIKTKLVQNSTTQKLVKFHHTLNTLEGLSSDLPQDYLEELSDYFNETSQKKETKKLKLRYLLTKINELKPTDTEKFKSVMKQFNDIAWKYKFDFPKPARVEITQNLKDPLDSKIGFRIPTNVEQKLSLQNYIDSMFLETADDKFTKKFKQLSPSSLYHVKPRKLFERSPSKLFWNFLQDIPNFCGLDDIEKYLNLFIQHKKKREKSYELPQFVYRKMTLVQLMKLRELNKDLKHQQTFNLILMTKMFTLPVEGSKLQNFPEKAAKYFQELHDWAKANVKSEIFLILVKKAILVNNRALNVWDIKLFEEYLKRPPIRYNNFTKEYKEKLYNRVLSNSGWSKDSLIPYHYSGYSDSVLIEEYCRKLIFLDNHPDQAVVTQTGKNSKTTIKKVAKHIRKIFKKGDEADEPNFKILKKYLDYTFLNKIRIYRELVNGEPLDSNIHDFISEAEIKEIRQAQRLQILDHNKKRFTGVWKEEGNDASARVQLVVGIKNIPAITVKTFEINTEAYYRDNLKSFQDDIDLDGLLASSQTEYDFSDRTSVEYFEQTFEFPQISSQKRGLFVVEITGGGLTSRAVIRKGALTLIRQNTLNGVLFLILNEAKKICKGEKTGIFVKDKWYQVNAKGEVYIPYSKSNKVSTSCVLVHNNFADIAPFEVPKDSYCFFTSLMFNEESLQVGHTTKIIIQPKLLLNLKVMTLKKLYNIVAKLTMVSDSGVKSVKEFKDLSLTYSEDLVLDFLMPPKIREIGVELEAFVKNIQGEEIKLKTNDAILINKHSGAETYYTTYLRWTQRGYELKLVGKNGEILRNKTLKITLERSFLNSEKLEFLVSTGEAGSPIKLGSLPNVTNISVEFPNSGLPRRSWALHNKTRSFHIQSDYEICKGEDLVIPSFSTDPHPLKHSLIKLDPSSSEYPVTDFFGSIRRDGNDFILSSLPPGSYKFVYREDINFAVFLTVLDGKRWSYSQSYIDHDNHVSKMLGDLNYLTINDLSLKEDGELTFKLNGNQMERTKVHIFGYMHYPDNADLFHRVTRRLCPTFMKEMFSLAYYENSYLSERKLPDEIKYVLDRRGKTKFMGNTLEKPPVLLKRHFVKETFQEDEQLRGGQDFNQKNRGANEMARMDNMRGRVSAKSKINYGVEQIGQFLACQGLTLSNIKPDSAGFVKVNIPNLSDYGHLQIYVGDPMSTLSTEVAINAGGEKMSDTRLNNPKKEGSFFSANRFNIVLANEGERANIDDLENTEYTLISNPIELFDYLKLLSLDHGVNGVELEKWRFLTNWLDFDYNQKLVKYVKFQSHELNVFIYFKDPDFFSKCVVPHLESKSELTLIDYILLGETEKIKEQMEIWNYGNLNALELALGVLLLRSEGLDPQLEVAILGGLRAAVGKRRDQTDETFCRQFDTVLEAAKIDRQKLKQSVTQPRYLSKVVVPPVKSRAMNSIQITAEQILKRPATKGFYNNSRARDAPVRLRGARQVRRQASFDSAEYMPDKRRASISRPKKKRKAKRMRSRSSEYSCSSEDDEDEALSMEASMMSEASIVYSAAMMDLDKDIGVLDDLQAQDFAFNQFADNAIDNDFQKLEKTKEYTERHYFYPDSAKTILINEFWLDTIEAFIKDELDYANLSPNFTACCRSITEILAILSIMTFIFPSEAENGDGSPKLSTVGTSLKVEATSPTLIFCKETKEKAGDEAERLDLDVMIAQCFYDPDDKYIYDQLDSSMKILKKVDQFLVGRKYCSKVTVTNPNEIPLNLQVLTEVPEGSIPVTNLLQARTFNIRVEPMATSKIEFTFYFPERGLFAYYPATVVKNGRFVKSANLVKSAQKEGADGRDGFLEVVDKKSGGQKMETINDVLSSGQKSDILKFMETANLFNKNIFEFRNILWLLKDAQFFKDIIKLLRKRLIFEPQVWSFSILHGARTEFFEFLRSRWQASYLLTGLKYLKINEKLKIDNFLLREYNPLLNPRIHNMGDKQHNILNRDFRNCYKEFLEYCFEKGGFQPKERLVMTCYLILQDRIQDALDVFSEMKDADYGEERLLTVQFDYLKAYLSLYTESPEFATAREISRKYVGYHLLNWRNRFVRIANQLAEFDSSEFSLVGGEGKEGENVEIFDENEKSKAPGANGAPATSKLTKKKAVVLRAKLKQSKIEVTFRNVQKVKIRFYLNDIEFLFSKDPFLLNGLKNFTYVNPNHEISSYLEGVEIDLNRNIVQKKADDTALEADNNKNQGLRRQEIDIPEHLKDKNLLVYVFQDFSATEAPTAPEGQIEKETAKEDPQEALEEPNQANQVGINEESSAPNRAVVVKRVEPILLTYFPINFKLGIYPRSGIIKTYNTETKRPICKIYVKSFVRTLSGDVKFFKDGYTDLRGIFDYATGVGAENAAEFAILVKDDLLGSVFRVVPSPKAVGGKGVGGLEGARRKKKQYQFDGRRLVVLEDDLDEDFDGLVEVQDDGLREHQFDLLKKKFEF